MHRQKMQVESRQAKHRLRNRDGGVQYCDVNWFCDSFTNSKLTDILLAVGSDVSRGMLLVTFKYM